MKPSMALAIIFTLAASAITTLVSAQVIYPEVLDPPNPHFYYTPEKGLADFNDKLILDSGELRLGKVLEWGNLVYFWDKTTGAKNVYSRDNVRGFEIHRSDNIRKKPDLPDLTVAYIERTPQDQGWHGLVAYEKDGKEKGLPWLIIDPSKYQLHPEPGQLVTFHIHVLNAGLVTSKPFSYSIWIDDKPLTSGRVSSQIEPGSENVIELKWKWLEGQHYIKVLLDTNNENQEIAEWNNTFIDPLRALTFFFSVSRNTYEGFSKNLNLIDTFNFEDWAQFHVHMMNWLFTKSVWPSQPEGILERVRIDKIIVVEDARGEEESRKYDPKRKYEEEGEILPYNGFWFFGKVQNDEHAARWAQQVDWGLPHELGHQLGLVDEYWLNHDPWEVLVRNRNGYYANIKHFFPWPKTMMHWHGPHIFSERDAAYLNRTLGRPRGFFGDYYYQIPEKNFLKVISNTGKPLDGVEITVYQPWIDPSGEYIAPPEDKEYPWAFGPDPVFAGRTDSKGIYLMPNRPTPHVITPMNGYELKDNPWGQINVVGDNCVLLAKLNYGDHEEFHWLRLWDFNIGAIRGSEKEFTYTLSTRFPEPGAPEPPQDVKATWHNKPGKPELVISWKPASSPDITEYRVYRKSSIGGDETKPFRLYNVIPVDKIGGDGRYWSHAEYHEEFRFQGHYRPDSYFAVTAVDASGKESALSYTIFVPKVPDSCKLAVGPDGRIYVTFYEGREVQVLIWDGKSSFIEMGLRSGISNYMPGAQGIAFDKQGRMIVTDPWPHQVAMYTLRGDAVKIVGKPDRREGSGIAEFSWPGDVAIADDGRIFVADTKNNRIQIFDSELNFLSSFGEKGEGELQFNEPGAISITGGKLCVADRSGTVRVIDITGESPKELYRTEKLSWPDRAVFSPSGKLYVCCDNDGGSVRVYTVRENEGAYELTLENKLTASEGVAFNRPKGLTPDGKGSAYLVNSFPYQVLKIKLE